MQTSNRGYRFLGVCLALAGLFLPGCATTNWSMPTPSELVELGIVEADADVERLRRGRSAAIMDCMDCHRQYWPQEIHPKRWPHVGRDMGEMSAMTDRQISDLVAYMVVASKTRDFSTGD